MANSVKHFTAKPLFANNAPQWNINLAPDGLGEAPTWDPRINALYWIDILGRTVSVARFGSTASAARVPEKGGYLQHWLDTAQPSVQRFVLPDDGVGFLALTSRPGVVLIGSSNGLLLFDTRRGAVVQRGTHHERHLIHNRYNDGKIAPNGELWAGTMQYRSAGPGLEQHPANTGRFYRHKSGLFGPATPVAAVGLTTITNGLGWTPDNKTFFHSDTATFTVSKYDVGSDWEPVNKRTLRNFGERIDGMCVDALGNPWVTLLDGAKVINIDRDTGKTLAEIELPGAAHCTSACFGGPGLRLMFITTAASTSPEGVTELRRKDPFNPSGHIYVVELGVAGTASELYPLRMSNL